MPKILPEDVSMRTVVREPQLADQLVEVPTNPGYALAVVAVQTLGWRTTAALIEQFGPGRGGGGDRGGSRGSRPERHRQAWAVWKYRPGMIVDVLSIMQLVFQQSKSYVFFAAIQFLDRVLDIPVVPQKGDSTVQSLNKVVDAVVYDSCLWSRQCSCVHRQGRRHPCSCLRNSGGASDSVIDSAQ